MGARYKTRANMHLNPSKRGLLAISNLVAIKLGRKEEAGEQIHHTRLGSKRPVIESGKALLCFLASLDRVRTLPEAHMSMSMVESLCPIYTTCLRDYSFSHSSLLATVDPLDAGRPKSTDAM
jgi:hypothetical protein